MRELRWGTTRIAYVLSRSAQRKTLSIRVEPNGDVHVVAPANAAPERIEAVVRAKAQWIVAKRRRASEIPPPIAARAFVSGETFLYLGRQYRLRVRTGANEGVRLAGRFLEVTAPRGARERVRDLLLDWYRERAAARLPERVETWATAIGAHPKAVLLREPRRRWGSCDRAGNVRLNFRIVQAPQKLVDYVVAHELVHLIHEDHGPAFWAALGRVMPDYDERREALRRLGGSLTW